MGVLYLAGFVLALDLTEVAFCTTSTGQTRELVFRV